MPKIDRKRQVSGNGDKNVIRFIYQSHDSEIKKEDKDMLNEMVRKAVISVSKKITKATVNSTCCALIYQDKIPNKAKKLRKF